VYGYTGDAKVVGVGAGVGPCGVAGGPVGVAADVGTRSVAVALASADGAPVTGRVVGPGVVAPPQPTTAVPVSRKMPAILRRVPTFVTTP
jgi:hypothetical protein